MLKNFLANEVVDMLEVQRREDAVVMRAIRKRAPELAPGAAQAVKLFHVLRTIRQRPRSTD